MELIKFIFSSFWVFIGFMLILETLIIGFCYCITQIFQPKRRKEKAPEPLYRVLKAQETAKKYKSETIPGPSENSEKF